MPTDAEILDAVSAWHKSASEAELYEWLGWSWEEYAQWVRYDQVPDRPLANGGNHD